jgi:predicted MFS family arabinose efflux permease
VPALTLPARRGVGLSFLGSAQNLTLVVLPPLSIAVLDASGRIEVVAATVIAFVVAGMVLAVGPARVGEHSRRAALAAEPGRAPRSSRLSYRRSWTLPLATILLYVAHWGVIIAYLPARSEASDANIGLFFAADGLAILLLRIPTGAAADRIPGRWLVLAGLALSTVGLVLLLVPPTTPILVASGILGGAGGGLVITPVLVELSRRSDDRDRGSAFSLFSGALAGAIALGSLGGAPVVALAGFEAAIALGIAGVAVAAVLTLADTGLSVDPRAARSGRTVAA